MLQTGDQVVYGIHGICTVIGQEQRRVDRQNVTYYVLEPLEQSGARFFVPSHNPAAMAKVRPLLSREELTALLCSSAVRQDAWIPDENQRKQRYRELIGSGDRCALLQMVRSLHRHREAQLAAGRKFHLCDENFLRDAQKLLDGEFSRVLDIPQAQVAEYMMDAIRDE